MVTLAITTYNRFDLTIKSFEHVINDDRIDEIVIVDDCSTDGSFEKLTDFVMHKYKISLYQNEKNLGCYHNKRRAIELSSNEWVILFDSDNVINTDYLDALDETDFKQVLHVNHTIVAPSFAKPHFDYRGFSNKTFFKGNIKDFIDQKNFDCIINTCNFVVNREEYLKVFDQGKEEPWTADTLYFNYCWLKEGNEIYIAPGLEYEHLVHDGSHYKANVQKTGNFAKEIMDKLRRL